MIRDWKQRTYPKHTDELGIGNVTVFVLVKVVEDDTQLLSGQEYAKLRHELLELQLLEHAILVAVKALHIKIISVSGQVRKSFEQPFANDKLLRDSN